MSSFKYVIVSKDDKFSLGTTAEIEALATSDRVVKCISNNTKSLPDVYNSEIDARFDYVVLMHADVKLDIASLESHVTAVADKYDVIGLCGTSIMNVSQSPLNWWTGSNPTPQSKWGCVCHGELGNQVSYFSAHSPTTLDHEVACIDGLCIILTKKAILSGLRFDPLFKYDFYDSDISFQTVMKYNLRLGVIVEKSLQHYSVGKSILTSDFLKHELDFRKKWNLGIPENSAVSKVVAKP